MKFGKLVHFNFVIACDECKNAILDPVILIMIFGFSVEEIEEVMAAGRQEEPLKLPQDSVASKLGKN